MLLGLQVMSQACWGSASCAFGITSYVPSLPGDFFTSAELLVMFKAQNNCRNCAFGIASYAHKYLYVPPSAYSGLGSFVSVSSSSVTYVVKALYGSVAIIIVRNY